MHQHLKWGFCALLVLLISACSPSSESDKSDANSAVNKGFSISLPGYVVLNDSNSIKPSALGQLMKLTNFGLKKVFLVTDGQPWKGATGYLTPIFGNKIEFVQVTQVGKNNALQTQAHIYELTHSQPGQWQRFLFNWIASNNAVIAISSEELLDAFAGNIALMQALQFLLSSAQFQSVRINKDETYFLDESKQLEGRLLQQTNDQTAFIVLNQTNSTQTLPLPFGFMAVAKVTRWQTGESQFATFVTSTPLTVNPQSLAIVIRR